MGSGSCLLASSLAWLPQAGDFLRNGWEEKAVLWPGKNQMAITSGAMRSQLTLCPKASAAPLLQSPLLKRTPESSLQSPGGLVNAEGGFRQRQTVLGAPP